MTFSVFFLLLSSSRHFSPQLGHPPPQSLHQPIAGESSLSSAGCWKAREQKNLQLVFDIYDQGRGALFIEFFFSLSCCRVSLPVPCSLGRSCLHTYPASTVVISPLRGLATSRSLRQVQMQKAEGADQANKVNILCLLRVCVRTKKNATPQIQTDRISRLLPGALLSGNLVCVTPYTCCNLRCQTPWGSRSPGPSRISQRRSFLIDRAARAWKPASSVAPSLFPGILAGSFPRPGITPLFIYTPPVQGSFCMCVCIDGYLSVYVDWTCTYVCFLVVLRNTFPSLAPFGHCRAQVALSRSAPVSRSCPLLHFYTY